MHNWFNFNWFAKQKTQGKSLWQSKRDKWRLQFFIRAKKGGQHAAVYAPYYFFYLIWGTGWLQTLNQVATKSVVLHTHLHTGRQRDRHTHMISAPTHSHSHLPSAKTSSTVTVTRPTVKTLPTKLFVSFEEEVLCEFSNFSFLSNFDRIFFIFLQFIFIVYGSGVVVDSGSCMCVCVNCELRALCRRLPTVGVPS